MEPLFTGIVIVLFVVFLVISGFTLYLLNSINTSTKSAATDINKAATDINSIKSSSKSAADGIKKIQEDIESARAEIVTAFSDHPL